MGRKMSAKEKIDKENKLDQWVKEYVSIPPEEKAYRKKLWDKIMIAYWDLFVNEDENPNVQGGNKGGNKDYVDAIDAIDYIKDKFEWFIKNYQPEKGLFTHYVRATLKHRKERIRDSYEKHNPEMFSGDRLQHTVNRNADENLTLEDNLPNKKAVSAEKTVLGDMAASDLMGKIIYLVTHLEGRANNPERRNWFRLFFTEDITRFVQVEGLIFSKEREIFETIKQPYLDFYMSDICRTQKKIQITPLKMYGEIVPGQDCSKEPPLPLPGDVSLTYLKQCEGKKAGVGARGNQKVFYEQTLEKLKNREE